MATADSTRWQCDKTLPQCLQYMLDNSISCDVTFVVGEGRQEVHAHKFMLISRSPVFNAMLDGPLAEKGRIEIPDVDKETFMIFLRYLYTDNADVTADNAICLLYIAKKYCVDRLSDICSVFLTDKLDPTNACVLLEAARKFSEKDFFQKCLSVIINNPDDCIKGNAFSKLSVECLKSITESVEMVIKEEYLYQQVMKWSEAECGRRKLDVTPENKRRVLGDVLFDIRFPLMDREFFARHVAQDSVLSSDEMVEIFIYHSTQVIPSKKCFEYTRKTDVQCSIEKVTPIPVKRFMLPPRWGVIMIGDDWSVNGIPDAISFRLSHDSMLHGVLLYGCCRDSCVYNIDVQIINDKNQTLRSRSLTYESHDTEDMFEVTVDPLSLQANTMYTVVVVMQGSISRYGWDGQKTVAFGIDKSITFYESDLSDNGTNVTTGQIPGLLLV